MKRKWKFVALMEDGSAGYLTHSGDPVLDGSAVKDFIGTDHEADAEAKRRADLYEDNHGGIIERIVYESQGKVS